MRRFRSLRWQLFFSYTPLVLVLMATLGAYLLVAARGLYLDGTDEQLASEARLVALAIAPLWSDPAAIGPTTRRLGQESSNRVTIIARDGTVLGDSQADPARLDNHASRPEVRAALSGGTGRSTRHSGTLGSQFHYTAVPIKVNGEVVGVARVARPLDETNALLARLGRIVILGILAGGLLAAGLAFLLARHITAPINALTTLVDAMAAGQLGRRSVSRSGDEIGRLERAFNRMARRLARTITLINAERSKLTAVLETLDDGLLMIDEAGSVTLANSAASRLLAPAARQALIGRTFASVARDHELLALVRDTLRSGEARAAMLETTYPRRTLRAIVTPVRGEAEPLVLLVLQDLTEVRRLETARRDFVANISHELRTPLASIKALVETLEDGAIEDQAVARRFLHQVDEEVDHLTLLVRDLLELSRLEAGEIALDRVAVAPEFVLEQAASRLRAQATRAGVALEVLPAPGLPAVWADPARVGQVLLNLLHNAIKFTPPGGSIALAAEARDGVVAFTVRDTGTGVAPDLLPRIFERFYKADKARSSTGTGLGLAIAKHLINAHGGTLTAANNVGGPGATFTVTLPLATPALVERAR